MNFSDLAKKYTMKVIKIIFWPFIAIIEIFNFIIDLLNNLGRKIKQVVNYVNNLFANILNGIESAIKKKKRWKNFFILIGKITTTNTNLLHGYFLGGFSGVLIVLLQTISFFTTFGGTSYYFSDIGDWVPYVFAFVIQCTIVTFSIRSSDKTRHKFPQKLALSLAIIISILFSYIGTINSAIEPYEEFSTDYEKFSESVNVLKEKSLSDKSVALSKAAAIELINDKIIESQNVCLIADMIYSGSITSFDPSMLFSNEFSVDGDTTAISISIDENTKLILDSIMNDEKISKALTHGIENLKSVLYSDVSNSKDLSSSFTSANILTNITSQSFDTLFADYNKLYIATAALDSLLINNFNDFYKPSFSIEKIEQSDFIKKIENYKVISSLSVKSFDEFINTNSNKNKLEDFDGIFVNIWSSVKNVFSMKTSAMETYRTVVGNAQKEANRVHNLLNTVTSSSTELMNIRDEFEKNYNVICNAEDATIVAFKRLFNKNTFNRAIIPAVLAILVDGGTVLISWAGQRRKYSYLYANTNRDYFEEEIDLFEEVFIAANGGSGFLDIINNSANLNDDDFAAKCYEAVENTINFTNNYLRLFKPSPWTVNLGCGIYATAADLDKDSGYNSLTSLLLSLGYIISLNEKEFANLKKHYGEDYMLDSGVLKNEENYYFLRFRVENYLRQSLSSVSIYLKYIKMKL